MMRKKFVAIIACIAMLLTCFPVAGFAASSVKYWTWDDNQKKLIEETYEGNYTVIDEHNLLYNWGKDDDQEHWMVVDGKVTIQDEIQVIGHVNLVLTDGSELIAEQGIEIDNEREHRDKNQLSIFVQSYDSNMGKLVATGANQSPGIGGEGCNVVIYGGEIHATGGENGAGIGHGFNDDLKGNIVIYGGKITATGRGYGAGIGGNYYSYGMDLSIYSGTINAIGGDGGAGIGGGAHGSTGVIDIYDGTITAKGNSGAGIGSGVGDTWMSGNKTINIYGGTINASSLAGAGIGRGYKHSCETINIYAGNIDAESKDICIAGSSINIFGGTVHTIGQEDRNSPRIGGDKVLINGGTVWAIGSNARDAFGIKAGEFLTDLEGRKGSAVIFAYGGYKAISDEDTSSWNAIVFNKNKDGNYVGDIYGSTIAPAEDFTIPDNATLAIDTNETLIIKNGITMTIAGDDDNNKKSAVVTNYGTIQVDEGGTIIVDGTLNDKGTVNNNGMIQYPMMSNVPVTNVTLNESNIKLTKGQTETLTVTIQPENASNKEVNWTSSDEGVATVDNGKIAAVAPGTAIIKVTTVDGDKTATCEVTVKETTVAVSGVTLNKTEASLEVGKTLELEASVAPDNATNKAVTWKSSDEKVATVKDGKVTAVSVGSAEITVTTVDGNKTATCKVTVTAAPLNVTGVTLDKQTATLKSGESLTLKATVSPENATNKNVSWSSSDTKVATVDSNGVVKAVAPGKATITATTQDGSKTAKCVVTVESTNVAVTGVSLDKTSASLEVKDTLSLKATIAPANANNQNVIWSSSNEKVATVKDGVVTAVAPGEATITVKTVDGEKTATCKVTIKAQSSTPTDPTDPSNPEKPSYQPDITDTDNGTVTVSPSNPQEGDTVTITPKPNQGYDVDDVVVTDEDGNKLEVTENADGSFTFVQPEGEVTITVTFKENKDEPTDPADPSELPFGDVKTSDWFYDPVKYVYDKGLMTGTSATEFAPNLTTTRGMIVSILHRLEGGPVVENDAFSDVSSDDWYGQSVAWAASVGVVNGFEDGTFRPNDPITREQMAAILYNYSQYKGYDVSARADLSKYSDAASVSSWATEVLSWANAEGLVNGMTKTTLDPQASATRAQVATILMRYTQMIGE